MKLHLFHTSNLFDAATHLFQQLGIQLNSNTAEPLPVKDLLKAHYKDNDTFNSIDKTYFIGIIDNSVFQATGMFDLTYSYQEALQQGDKHYEGLMLFALQLHKPPTRSEISELTRTFNRISQKMPVALLLNYTIGKDTCFSLAISERFKYLQNWRQGEKAGKVIILRDINSQNTHAGHLRILSDLEKPVGVTNYDQLHQHWLQVLDVNVLNKKFFQELANWYFWAMENVSFPDDIEKKKEIRNATNLIRLITRVVFIWFIKEKALVPTALFNPAYLDTLLKDFNKTKKSQNYYHAILQNLFFGTLNQKMEERKFAKDGGNIGTNGKEYGVKNLFRYADLFHIAEKEAMLLFKDVPFLNGGLFDCLDKPNENGKIVYVDGFSRNAQKQASVPDYIFFGEERDVDLNEVFATKNKKYKSRGLINLLESYKFTVAENTPIEEEIALDPELLGKVFENLLASYNPETQTTARKQTGSFYTPREIVNYMVDESLLEYLKQNLSGEGQDIEAPLRELISYAETPNSFDAAETQALIEAINTCKILDPACGSGAYPMGILHKLVHLLQKLDPNNEHWKALQRKKAIAETETAFNIGDKEERGKRLAEINDVFENNASDYGRKLYLIENCIYGIDIQPIAVQISKLRFFISLIIDQKKQSSKENFGIRSLPNLETKFVAANTLIGLDKPTQTLLRNPQIAEKESELTELRHKYFTANTRTEKLQYQKQDKKLRQQIAKMLEDVGWQTVVAKQIVAFDPYDQNTFANWFDPEWMFGWKEGFDIVIGNPPYVSAPSMVNNYPELRKAIVATKKYTTLYQKWDLYIPFIELGLNLLANNGLFTMIVPYPLTNQTYGMKLRELILKQYRLIDLVDLNGTKIFDNATVSNCIPIISKSKPNKACYISKVNDLGEINREFTQKFTDLVQDENTLVWNLTTEKRDSLRHTEMNILGDYCYISVGMVLNADENTAKGEFSKEDLISEGYDEIHCRKYIEAKDIERYKVKKTRYLEYNTERCPDKLRRPTFRELYDKPKLMFNCLGSLMVYLDAETKFLHNHSLYSAVLWKDLEGVDNKSISTSIKRYSNHLRKDMVIHSQAVDLRYLLGILNAKYASVLLSDLRAGDYHIYPEHIRNLPIPKILPKAQQPFIHIVEYLLFQKSQKQDSTFFERLIDAMVYELYLPAEIQAGEAGVLAHLGDLPALAAGQDAENLEIIDKVYQAMSAPKHPICVALQKLLDIAEIQLIEGSK